MPQNTVRGTAWSVGHTARDRHAVAAGGVGAVAVADDTNLYRKSSQFSLGWSPCSGRSPYALHPVSKMFPKVAFENGSNIRLTDEGPFSSFQSRRIVLFPRLPPGDRR